MIQIESQAQKELIDEKSFKEVDCEDDSSFSFVAAKIQKNQKWKHKLRI